MGETPILGILEKGPETSAEPEVTDIDLVRGQPGLGRRRGLRKLKPNLIDKATDDTAKQVSRSLLVFIGTTLFCLLSLLSPDSALLGGSERLNVPLAGPVSFFGFMLLGPAVLIVLRVYLQIYVEHSDRLDRLAGRMPVTRVPTLIPRENPLIRVISGLAYYLLLPAAILFFAWKAAVFPFWGSGLLCVAVGVIVGHVMLPLRSISWRNKALPSLGAALLAGGILAVGPLLGFGPVRRPFDLVRANLSGQWLRDDDLRGANLTGANLTGADLMGADLTGANLFGANLAGVNLEEARLASANLLGANLTRADLSFANLTFATLTGADLMGADLTGANLTRAFPTQQQLDQACGSKPVALPSGLTWINPAPRDPCPWRR